MDRNLNRDHFLNTLDSNFHSCIQSNIWNSGKMWGFSLESLINLIYIFSNALLAWFPLHFQKKSFVGKNLNTKSYYDSDPPRRRC